ncbi:MAG: helix-turn-helix domain-containing protein [Prevotella sp.]|jgi:ATP-dependent DNA helicase RecG
MTIEDIQSLIANGESITLEFKKSTGELKDAMHTACAFLNTDGGWLIFGIAPASLKILGQDVTDNTQREISQSLTSIEPAVEVQIEYIDVPDRPGKKVIAIYFNAFVWGNSPYTYEGRPYYRVESTTKLMPRELFEERIIAHRPKYYSWERQKADGISINDLNEERVRGALRLGC